MPNSAEINQNASPGANQKLEPEKIEMRERITREDLRAEKNKTFLFGDNLTKRGYGGQAREMRGEENAVGIPTKKASDNRQTSFLATRNLRKRSRLSLTNWKTRRKLSSEIRLFQHSKKEISSRHT